MQVPGAGGSNEDEYVFFTRPSTVEPPLKDILENSKKDAFLTQQAMTRSAKSFRKVKSKLDKVLGCKTTPEIIEQKLTFNTLEKVQKLLYKPLKPDSDVEMSQESSMS